MSRAALSGVTLVELMIALAVLAINIAGWSALMRLVVMLLQRTAELVAILDGPDAAALCSLAMLVPMSSDSWRPQPASPAGQSVAKPTLRCRGGFTIVEALIAIALSALVFTLAAAGYVSTARLSNTALASGDALMVRLALPIMLRQTIEVAGRGVNDGCALAAAIPGRLLSVTVATSDDILVVDQVFAALDGGGRSALYMRRLPHARQPWIEDVTSFDVLDAEVGEGDRLVAIEVAVEHRALNERLVVRIELPHRPCLDVSP